MCVCVCVVCVCILIYMYMYICKKLLNELTENILVHCLLLLVSRFVQSSHGN